jgi:hypothetical protein
MFWGRTLGDGMKYRLGTLYPDATVQNMHGILAPEVSGSKNTRTIHQSGRLVAGEL